MSMRKDIQNAFDNVHAPDELVERMKQELYQKDMHEDIEEITFDVKEAPRRNYLRNFGIVAAALAVCIGCGITVLQLRENPLKPASPVVPTTEATTEAESMTAEEEYRVNKSSWEEAEERKAVVENAWEQYCIENSIREEAE